MINNIHSDHLDIQPDALGLLGSLSDATMQPEGLLANRTVVALLGIGCLAYITYRVFQPQTDSFLRGLEHRLGERGLGLGELDSESEVTEIELPD